MLEWFFYSTQPLSSPPPFNHHIVLVTLRQDTGGGLGLPGKIRVSVTEEKPNFQCQPFRNPCHWSSSRSREKLLYDIWNEKRLLLRFESSSSSSRIKNINLGILKTWFHIQALPLTLTIFFQLGNANNTYLMELLWKLNEIMSINTLCKLQMSTFIIMIIILMPCYLCYSKYYTWSGRRVSLLMLIIQIHSRDHLCFFTVLAEVISF